MVLFEEDWKYYPGIIADTKTRNTSFVRLAMLYKHMGVSNHLFLLALHNRELQGIDPFLPNLTLDVQSAILMECKINLSKLF